MVNFQLVGVDVITDMSIQGNGKHFMFHKLFTIRAQVEQVFGKKYGMHQQDLEL